MSANSSKSSDRQSESMGRSSSSSSDEEEEIVPMKSPQNDNDVLLANNNNNDEATENDTSFLDEDFLSFGHVDNGGEEVDNTDRSGSSAGGKNRKGDGYNTNSNRLAGKKRERPQEQHNTNTSSSSNYGLNVSSIPWLDGNCSSNNTNQSQQFNQNQGYNRGYRGYNNNHHHRNNYNYNPPTPPLLQLHNEIVSFMKLMSPTSHEIELRSTMERRIIALAHRVFGKDNCEVLPFGSQVTGLALPGSDIDFVIRFPKKDGKKKSDGVEKEEEEEDVTTTLDPLQRIADAVRAEFGVKSVFEMDDTNDSTSTTTTTTTTTNNNNKTSNKQENEHLSYLEIISQTRVPLVKFTIAPYNLDIDICFDQPHGPESAELMHRFMESMPPLRPLTFCLKYFLSSRDINKPFTGGIGSYLLQLLIVSFLQHRARSDLHRGYGASGQHWNLGSLLLDFLELYGLDFNYVTTGISVRHDGYYFPKGQLDKKEVFYQPHRPSSIAVENPLDPTMDVGAGAYRIQMISRVFEHAFKTLLAYVSEPVERTESILAKVLPVTEEMIERRRLKDGLEKREVDGGNGNDRDDGVPNKAGGGGKSDSRHDYDDDKRRGMKHRHRSERHNTSKNWDKNKDNKKRRHSGGSDRSGDSYSGHSRSKSKKKKKRHSK